MEKKDTYFLPKFQQTVDAGEFARERELEISALKKLAGKNNNAFIMGMMSLDEPVKPGVFEDYYRKKAEDANLPGMGSSAWEAVKGYAVGSAKGPFRFAGHLASTAFPLIAKTATTLYAASGSAGGPESADKFVREANKGIESITNEIRRFTGIDDAGLLENIVGGGISSVMVGIAGGGYSATAFGLSAGQDTYVRQREGGVGVGESLFRAGTHGIAETALEKLQINRIWGALAKKSKPFKILKDIVENSAQEMAQSGVEMATNWNVDKKTLGEVAFELGVSAAGGAVGAGAGHVGGHVLNQKTIDKVGDLMKKTGHSDEEIQNVKKELNKLVETDELQRAANEVMKDELTTVALTYKEQAQAMSEEVVAQLEDTIARNELVDLGGGLMEDKTEGMPALYQLGEMQIDTAKNPHLGMVLYQAEQAGHPMQTLGQAIQWAKTRLGDKEYERLNTGINFVYGKTYGMLKGMGQDDSLADSNARIRSAMAYTLAKNFDMTPEEADNMLGGIVQQKAGDFTGNKAMTQFQEVAQHINEIDAEEQANGVPEYTQPTININGVERQTTNSDGNSIAKSEKALRYFYNWFGDSKVVDEQGRPLVVYHGTNAEFDTFKGTKILNSSEGVGFNFAVKKDIAEGFGKVMPVYLKLENPVYAYSKIDLVSDTYEDDFEIENQEAIRNAIYKVKENLEQKGYTFYNEVDSDMLDNYSERSQAQEVLDGLLDLGSYIQEDYDAETLYNDIRQAEIDAFGIDGYITNNYGATGGKVYIAFKSNQIKSTSNRGTFSSSENIYLQSAYAGSRVDYDKPSLEAIGSGEGAQVHGCGLYYALNRDVAEYYREKFAESDVSYEYDGDAKLTNAEIRIIGEYGLNKAIQMAERQLDLKTSQGYSESDIEEQKAIIEKLKSVNENDIKKIVKENKGQVHEVDIPENPYLLDEQKSFGEQSDFVQQKLVDIVNNLSEEQVDRMFNKHTDKNREMLLDGWKETNGRNIYNELSTIMGGDKNASLFLSEKGIKGITYDGRKDGRCFVIFNPEDVKVIQKFYQDEASPRGAYYKGTVYLFENADESTFVHEMSHAYMDVLERLAQGGNTKAQKDLDKIRKWLNKKEGEAFTVADWERFARGFEMYVREGKAPNEYLGGKDGVFSRFKHWLLSIYGGIKNLTIKNEQGKDEEVKINPQIKRFYDEMLGGVSIDDVFNHAQKNNQALAVLENKLLELSDIQQRLAEERAKLVREMADNVIPETKWANFKDWGKNVLESMKETPAHILKSSSERLSKIDKRLGLLVQRVEQSQGLRIKRWSDQIKPFYDVFNKLSPTDKARVQFYLLNQQWGDVAEIVGQEETDAIHGMLEGIYKELQASGVEVGYRSNYFPRSVLDYDGLLKEMGLTNPSLIKQMEDAIGKDATPQEQAEWLDRHVMGFKGNVSINGNRNTKERKLDLITVSMAQYYKPSMETLVDYMNGMAKLLSMRDMFGRNIEYKEGNKENAEDTIGQIINNIYGEGKLTKKETDEVREVLGALYLPTSPSWKWLQAMRQYGYATKLSYSTTVRQFADIGMTMKVNGVLNSLNAIFHPDKRITLKELGVDPLGEEFRTSQKDVGGSVANFFTKWRGINKADELMKNTFLRGKYLSLKELSKKPDEFHEKYDALFGDEVDTLIKDLNEDKVSEPVKVLLFHEISKIQPISRSAMPTSYLTNPNGRVFYMFKTFSLHRAEYIISELAEDFRTKNYKKAGKDIMADVAVIGWEGLIEILIAFLKYGFPALAGKAVLDAFMGSSLGVFGLNKHQATQLASGKMTDFIQEQIGFGSPLDDLVYLWRNREKDDKLIRAVLPDIIIEPLVVGPKEMRK